MIEPKEIIIKNSNGKEVAVEISKFPATIAREILIKRDLLKGEISEYSQSEDIMYKTLKYAAIKLGDKAQPLVTSELINNHFDWQGLISLEKEILVYNFDFLAQGNPSNS